MNLNDYFDPVSLEKPENNILDNPAAFCRNISIHTPNFPIRDLDLYQLALIGVPEERGSLNEGCEEAPDLIRNKLYQLIRSSNKLKIIDLGNLKAGMNPADTLIGLRDVLIELVGRGICTIIMGGAQHLTLSSTLAMEKEGKPYHLTTIDSHFDFQTNPQTENTDYYLNSVLHTKGNLLSFTNLGHQQYFAEKEQIEFLDNHYHHYLRLGSLRNAMREAEPILRDTDLLSMDIRSVRYADAPGFYNTSPNGFYGEEVCQLARYAGLSQNIKIFGLYNVNPVFDNNHITAHLAAQIIWYFTEGFTQRILELPTAENAGFRKFIVKNSQIDPEMIFYKSLVTDRWWVEVPVTGKKKKKPLIVSCSAEDYQAASGEQIPERWWKLLRRLS